MASDDDATKESARESSPSTGLLGPEAIDELYRLAEILMGPSSTLEDSALSRRRIAAERMEELLRSLDAGGAATARVLETHKWVLDVLQDLASYAEERDLADVHRVLVDARFLAYQALKKS